LLQTFSFNDLLGGFQKKSLWEPTMVLFFAARFDAEHKSCGKPMIINDFWCFRPPNLSRQHPRFQAAFIPAPAPEFCG
jgi:hypothetical protein